MIRTISHYVYPCAIPSGGIAIPFLTRWLKKTKKTKLSETTSQLPSFLWFWLCGPYTHPPVGPLESLEASTHWSGKCAGTCSKHKLDHPDWAVAWPHDPATSGIDLHTSPCIDVAYCKHQKSSTTTLPEFWRTPCHSKWFSLPCLGPVWARSQEVAHKVSRISPGWTCWWWNATVSVRRFSLKGQQRSSALLPLPHLFHSSPCRARHDVEPSRASKRPSRQQCLLRQLQLGQRDHHRLVSLSLYTTWELCIPRRASQKRWVRLEYRIWSWGLPQARGPPLWAKEGLHPGTMTSSHPCLEPKKNKYEPISPCLCPGFCTTWHMDTYGGSRHFFPPNPSKTIRQNEKPWKHIWQPMCRDRINAHPLSIRHFETRVASVAHGGSGV